MLIEALNLQGPVKPYRRQYKTIVGPKTIAKSRIWLVVKVG